MEKIPNKQYFRPDEVAEILQVSVRTVRRWIAQGQMPGVRAHWKGVRINKWELAKRIPSKDIQIGE